MKKIEPALVIAIVYGSMLVLTFGHIWARLTAVPDTPEAMFIKAILSMVGAIFWPFYWSGYLWG